MAQNPRPRRPWEEVSGSTPAPCASPEPTERETHGDALMSGHVQAQVSVAAPTQFAPSPSFPDQTSSVDHIKHPSRASPQLVGASDEYSSWTLPAAKKRRLTSTASPTIPLSAPDPANPSPLCCSPTCRGAQCLALRRISALLQTEIAAHEVLVHGTALPVNPAPNSNDTSTPISEIVDRVRSRLEQSNMSLRNLLDGKSTPAAITVTSADTIPPKERIHQDPRSSIYPNDPKDITLIPITIPSHESDKISAQRSPSTPPAPRFRLPSSGNQPPSPLSLNMPHPTVPQRSTSPSTAAAPAAFISTSSAQASASDAVLQDLQHQLAVKTLAYTTLAKEYDMLFQKLSRQRVKCSTLERKFEVSDAEIITLSNEKERCEERIEGLEQHIMSLEKQRDAALKAKEDSKSQWLQIMGNATKLHGGTDINDKAWVEERARLTRRVEELEADLHIKKESGDGTARNVAGSYAAEARSRTEWLDDEVVKLRERNAKLESGLAAAKQAALTLAAHGQNVGNVLKKALGE